ncbi:MAG: hypothetical protein IJ468_08570 [Lachnospiraceae bacterium]|nr:hypothetical protein [Lachnospiraceae bacterium]
MNRDLAIRTMKITFGAILAISIATLFHLNYSASAGIITILTLQTTRRETIQTALGRGLAFLCALVIAAVCFFVFGFTIPGFGIYLLFFSALCLIAGWSPAISMDSVLITHFLAEKTMSVGLIFNELLIFSIGTAVGILLNLHLHPQRQLWQEAIQEADESIRGILSRMAYRLRTEDKSDYSDSCFLPLSRQLEKARAIALTNINNSLFSPSCYELDYTQMRMEQSQVLKKLYASICMISWTPMQAEMVSDLFQQVSLEYSETNTCETLLAKLDDLYAAMKKEPLPQTREEFENRAVLYYIMKQMEEMLRVKKAFAETRSSCQ